MVSKTKDFVDAETQVGLCPHLPESVTSNF